MDSILKLSLASFETVLLILYLNTILIKSFEKKIIRHVLFGFYFVFQCLTYFIDSAFFSTSIYYIIFTVFIAWYCYIDEIRIKLMSSGMFVTLNYACKLLAVTSFAKYRGESLPQNPFDYVLNNQMQALACTLLLAVIIVIIWTRKLESRLSKIIIDIIIFMIPLTNLFVTMHLLGQRGNIYGEITLLLFSYTFLLFFIIDQIIYSSEAKQVSDAMKQRLEMQQVYYKDIQEYSNKMSRFRHDLKNHCSTLSYLLENGRIEEAKDFLNQYTQESVNIKPIINTGNNIIDFILNAKIKKARDADISVDWDIVVPPNLNISGVYMSVILGNLMDNAVEAASKLKKNKKINIKIQTYKQNLFINISNTYDGNIIVMDYGFLSTKKNKKEHGLGIGNVTHIVKKNKGTIDINYDNSTFNVSILIPNIIF